MYCFEVALDLADEVGTRIIPALVEQLKVLANSMQAGVISEVDLVRPAQCLLVVLHAERSGLLGIVQLRERNATEAFESFKRTLLERTATLLGCDRGLQRTPGLEPLSKITQRLTDPLAWLERITVAISTMNHFLECCRYGGFLLRQ